jgi:hypothetical protein
MIVKQGIWLMIRDNMKTLLAIGIIGLALFSGSGKPADPNQPQYPPPDNLGEGICLMFTASNDTEFHSRLNEYITFHKELRAQSIYEAQRDGDGHPTKWIVIVDRIAGVEPVAPVNTMPPVVPPVPGTQPVDPNNKGEIHY